jgi:Holliday junction resolvasome RuvABC endonuclease subunit
MSDKFISLDSLKEYNKQMKETYIEPLDEKIEDLKAKSTAIEKNVKNECEYIVLKVAPACGALVWAMELANGKLPDEAMREKILVNVENYQKTQAGTK